MLHYAWGTYVLGAITEDILAGFMWQHDYSSCWLIKSMDMLNDHSDRVALIQRRNKSAASKTFEALWRSFFFSFLNNTLKGNGMLLFFNKTLPTCSQILLHEIWINEYHKAQQACSFNNIRGHDKILCFKDGVHDTVLLVYSTGHLIKCVSGNISWLPLPFPQGESTSVPWLRRICHALSRRIYHLWCFHWNWMLEWYLSLLSWLILTDWVLF